jgi:hypothetical protein
VPDVFGDTEKPPEVSGRFPEVSGRIGLCGGIVPRARPVFSSGVAGGKPGLNWKFGVVPPIPVDGLLVRGAAPAVEATSIKPLAIKPMEVSFIWSSGVVRPLEGQRAPANWGSSTKCRCDE